MLEKRIAGLPNGLYAAIDTTRGPVLVEIFYKETPLAAANFVGLAEGKLKNSAKQGPFYNGLKFHRVINDFMIQGGDPEGTGAGGPGYRFGDEIVDGLVFEKEGLLAMANAGPGTNGSQFFITHVPTPWLNGKHTIFGRVVGPEDQAVVNAVRQDDEIKSVTVYRLGDEAKAFSADQAMFDSLLAGYENAESERQAAQKKRFEENNKAQISRLKKEHPQLKDSALGYYFLTEKAGSGAKPAKGDAVAFNYEVSVLGGQVFDSSYPAGPGSTKEPVEISVGEGYTLPALEDALLDMPAGETRRLFVPPYLAYGEAGAGNVIPPNAWLEIKAERVK